MANARKQTNNPIATPTMEATATGPGPNGLHREIELRAYYRYCQRGCEPGGELQDWLTAEQEVLAERQWADLATV